MAEISRDQIMRNCLDQLSITCQMAIEEHFSWEDLLVWVDLHGTLLKTFKLYLGDARVAPPPGIENRYLVLRKPSEQLLGAAKRALRVNGYVDSDSDTSREWVLLNAGLREDQSVYLPYYDDMDFYIKRQTQSVFTAKRLREAAVC